MPKYCLSLPNEIGNLTLNEIFSRPDVTVSYTNGILRAIWQEGDVDYGFELWGHSRSNENQKKQKRETYKANVLRLRKMGWTQESISKELKISQGYVSQLLHE